MSDPLTAADLSGVRLVREQRSRVRDLKGFRKSHQVPTEFNDRATAFVERIAADDISEELEQRFADFRRHLNFRRVELLVTEPDGGNGVISTPWFDYAIRATLAPDDASEVSWRRQLAEFRGPCQLRHAGMTALFSGMFDTVEVEPSTMPALADLIDMMEASPLETLTIDYDRHATWCHLNLKGVSGQVQLTSDRVSLVAAQPQSATALLESFVQLRSRFECLDCLRI